MISVFLSHSSSDKTFVEGYLNSRLVALGFRPWLDSHDIPVGGSIPSEIGAGLQRSDALILVLSASAVASEWVRRETDAWLMRDDGLRTLLPIRVEACQPPTILKPLKYVDFFPHDGRDVALAKLATSLTGVHTARSPGASAIHAPAPSMVAAALEGAASLERAAPTSRLAFIKAKLWRAWRHHWDECEGTERTGRYGPFLALQLRDRTIRGYVPHFVRIDPRTQNFIPDYTDGTALRVNATEDGHGSKDIFLEDVMDVESATPEDEGPMFMRLRPRSITGR